MRSSTAYFAGAGTVIAAIAAGLGGGYLFFSIVSPHPDKHGSSEVSRLERRMSSEPIQANKGAPEPVPYLDKPQVSAAAADPTAQPASQPQQQAVQPQPPQAPPQQAQPQPATTQQASTQPAAEQPAAREKSAPDDSWARARDADVRRDPRREERRKAERERRQQWSERRKWRQRDDDSELAEVERKVREDTEPRRVREDRESRPFFASEPARMEMPRIRLFGMDD